jgi:hypothetical protein
VSCATTGSRGKGTNGVNGQTQLVEIGKRFQDEEVHAALFERRGLLLENIEDFAAREIACLQARTERPDGAGNQHFARAGFARFARDFYAALIEARDFAGQAVRSNLPAVRSKRVGLDDLRSRLDVSLVHAEDRFGLGGVELIEAALRAHGFVEHRAHRAIGDENRIAQPVVEFLNPHHSPEQPPNRTPGPA